MYIFKSENCNILVCTLDADIPTINLQMFVNWRQVFDRKLFMTYYYKTISLKSPMSAKDTYAYREQCLVETNAYQIILIVRIKSLLETSLMAIRDLSVI